MFLVVKSEEVKRIVTNRNIVFNPRKCCWILPPPIIFNDGFLLVIRWIKTNSITYLLILSPPLEFSSKFCHFLCEHPYIKIFMLFFQRLIRWPNKIFSRSASLTFSWDFHWFYFYNLHLYLSKLLYCSSCNFRIIW